MNRHRVGRVVAVALGLATPALLGSASHGAPADPDPGFGVDGTATLDLGPTSSEAGFDLALQPDGRIVGVGYTGGPTSADGVAFRLSADGTPDRAFGNRVLDVAGGQESASAVAIQSDGRIVVAGRTTTNNDVAVWRLLPSGQPDRSFSGDGFFAIDSGGTEDARDVAIAPDGRIVVVGETTVGPGGSLAVYRLTSDGRMDGTFDGDGALGLGGDGHDEATSVAVLPDGRILVAGEDSTENTMRVRRLLTNGLPDSTFSGDGVAQVPGTLNRVSDLDLRPDGSVLVAGDAYNGLDRDGVVIRLTSAGAVDATFGGPTGARLDLGADETSFSVDVAPDGKVVVAGHTSAGYDAVVGRLRADGKPDTGFGPRGLRRLGGGSDIAYDATVQPDGRILVTGDDGTSRSNIVVVRLLGTPTARAGTCHGRKATIVGTPGKDRMRGTAKADVIVALGGNDVVKGLGGKDVVCGGDGADRLVGGAGKDLLLGQRGVDDLVGGSGKDRLVGGPGRDVVHQRD